MSRARTSTSNPSGIHLLTDRGPIRELVRAAALGPGDLVIDFGAGPGTLTGPLAATGARVLAVERDDGFARRLRGRFAGDGVRVVHGDLRRVPLPRREFSVVASIPFGASTALLRRLLGDPALALRGADLVVEWGFARRVTATVPRGLEAAWWAARFELALRRRIPAACFTPAPSVDAAYLRVRPVAEPLDRRGHRALWQLLRAVHARPGAPARRVLRGYGGKRWLPMLGEYAGGPAGEVPPARWAAVARGMTAGGPGLN